MKFRIIVNYIIVALSLIVATQSYAEECKFALYKYSVNYKKAAPSSVEVPTIVRIPVIKIKKDSAVIYEMERLHDVTLEQCQNTAQKAAREMKPGSDIYPYIVLWSFTGGEKSSGWANGREILPADFESDIAAHHYPCKCSTNQNLTNPDSIIAQEQSARNRGECTSICEKFCTEVATSDLENWNQKHYGCKAEIFEDATWGHIQNVTPAPPRD